MGTPVGGVISLLGGTTYMVMVDNFFTTSRYDFALSAVGNTTVIASSQLSSNIFVSAGVGDSLFFNSNPSSGGSIKFFNVTVVDVGGRPFMNFVSTSLQSDSLCQIESSVIANFNTGASVFENILFLISDRSRWLNSKTITIIDTFFVASDLAISNIPETMEPGISISSNDPSIVSQITLDQVGMLFNGMEIHSNLNAVSTILLDGSFVELFSFTPAPFFNDETGTVTAVADGSGGKIECTATGHNILEGDTVTHDTDFADVNYQGDFVASEVVEEVSYKVVATFGVTDTGTWTNKSLTQKDPRITAFANEKVSVPNSMTLGEAMTDGALDVDGSGGVAVAVVDIAPAPGNWIEDPASERVSVDTTTGLLTYNGLIDIALELRYKVFATPSSGGNQTLEFHLHINGVQQTKTKLLMDTAMDNNGFYVGGIFSFSPNDTVQLFKLNTSNTSDTLVEATVLALAV